MPLSKNELINWLIMAMTKPRLSPAGRTARSGFINIDSSSLYFVEVYRNWYHWRKISNYNRFVLIILIVGGRPDKLYQLLWLYTKTLALFRWPQSSYLFLNRVFLCKFNQLEKQLGLSLFDRSGHRQVQPTPAAVKLYATAEQLQRTWKQGTSNLKTNGRAVKDKSCFRVFTNHLGRINAPG